MPGAQPTQAMMDLDNDILVNMTGGCFEHGFLII